MGHKIQEEKEISKMSDQGTYTEVQTRDTDRQWDFEGVDQLRFRSLTDLRHRESEKNSLESESIITSPRSNLTSSNNHTRSNSKNDNNCQFINEQNSSSGYESKNKEETEKKKAAENPLTMINERSSNSGITTNTANTQPFAHTQSGDSSEMENLHSYNGVRNRKKSKRRERTNRSQIGLYTNSSSSTTSQNNDELNNVKNQNNNNIENENEMEDMVENVRQNIIHLEHENYNENFWISIFKNLAIIFAVISIIFLTVFPIETSSNSRASFTSLANFKPFGISLFEVSYPNGPPPV